MRRLGVAGVLALLTATTCLAQATAFQGAGGLYNMLSDPRTKFGFPHVVALPNGADTAPINAFLHREHERINLEALECLNETGSLGGYDEQVARVHLLSPKIMSITRAAAITCGGPSIAIFREHLNLDVTTGQWLDLTRIFANWDNRPSEALAAFIRTHVEEDYWQDGECDPGDGLAEHLAVTFVEPAIVSFYLTGMSPPCNDRIFSSEIAEMAPFLADGALSLFPH